MTRWLAIPYIFAVAVAAQPAEISPGAISPGTVASKLAAQGDHHRAIQLYQEILSSHDSLTAPVQTHRGLAMSLLMTGRTAEASSTVERAIARFPEDAGLKRVAAGIFSSQGQYAQAIELLEQAIRQEPDQATDHANLGGLHTNLGSYDDAEKALVRAAQLAPMDAVVHRRLGELYLKRHAYETAADELSQAVRLEPTSPTTVYLLGQALEGMADLESALARYELSREIDPSYMDAHYRTAQIARRLGQSIKADSAMAAYTHLQNVADGDADALKQMRALRDAIVESGDQPDHVFALAKFLFEHGYLDESQNRLEDVVRQQPNHYRAHNQLGNVHLQRRNPSRALVHYEAACRITPDFAPAALNAGNASMLLAQPGRAIAYYERAVALAPEVAMAWYGLGSAHLELGRRDVASKILRQGLERTHPEGRIRKAFLEQLRKANGNPKTQ
jgi:tetratricopeptide (TPR) repeat protein